MSDINVADRCRVEVNGWHLVTNKKRAITLAKRGEFIKWSSEYNCWIWDFNNRTTISNEPR